MKTSLLFSYNFLLACLTICSAEYIKDNTDSSSSLNLNSKLSSRSGSLNFDVASARQMGLPIQEIFGFLSDPSLIVTLLYTLEIAYWTLPLGFFLTPFINFFRVPNRRNGRIARKFVSKKDNEFLIYILENLLKSIETYNKINLKKSKNH